MELHSLSKVKPDNVGGMDSVAAEKKHNPSRAYDVLAMAQTFWKSLEKTNKKGQMSS